MLVSLYFFSFNYRGKYKIIEQEYKHETLKQRRINSVLIWLYRTSREPSEIFTPTRNERTMKKKNDKTFLVSVIINASSGLCYLDQPMIGMLLKILMRNGCRPLRKD